MFYRSYLPIALLACIFFSACFTTLPVSDAYAKQGEQSIFKWLSSEPLLETFPVNYDRKIESVPGAVQLQVTAAETQSYALTMLRNAGNLDDSGGKPTREKYRTEKRLSVGGATYGEEGKGRAIADVADMAADIGYSGSLRVSADNTSFAGTLTETIRLKASIGLGSFSAQASGVTEGDILAIRDMESGAVIGLNIPGYPVMPKRPVRVGDQWEITGYTEQKTRYTYSAGAPPTSLAAATLLLLTYQFHGVTDWNGKRCAYIEYLGETYEMRDFGGKSSLPALKGVAKTLSRSSISEVRAYLSRREYSPDSGLKGSFQASAKLAGYALIDLDAKKVVMSKMGKEGLTGGGSSLGMVQGTGKGVFREQWILEERL